MTQPLYISGRGGQATPENLAEDFAAAMCNPPRQVGRITFVDRGKGEWRFSFVDGSRRYVIREYQWNNGGWPISTYAVFEAEA